MVPRCRLQGSVQQCSAKSPSPCWCSKQGCPAGLHCLPAPPTGCAPRPSEAGCRSQLPARAGPGAAAAPPLARNWPRRLERSAARSCSPCRDARRGRQTLHGFCVECVHPRVVCCGGRQPSTAPRTAAGDASSMDKHTQSPDHRQLPQQAADATDARQVSGGRVSRHCAQQSRQRLHRALQQRVQQLRLLLILADLHGRRRRCRAEEVATRWWRCGGGGAGV